MRFSVPAPLHTVLLFVYFTAALTLGCWGVACLAPFPEVPQVTKKLAFYRAHHQQFDTIFIGSSRTNRQLNPAVFDEVAREHGVESRSFNFGIDGMFAPEDGYVVDQVVAVRPKLKRVVIELSPFHADVATRTLGARSAYWRDWKRTQIVFSQFFDRRLKPLQWSAWQEGLRQRADYWWSFAEYCGLFMQNVANVGRGAALVERVLELEKRAPKLEAVGDREDGYNALSRPGGLEGKALRKYEAALAERLGKDEAKLPLGPGGNANVKEMVGRFRKRGAEVFLVVAPVISRPRAYPKGKRLPEVFDFTDIQAWPELFVPENRYDLGHLNEAGSEIYTRALAELIFRRPAAEGK
ncbi:MAG TPA: hypothetical protein VF614_00750 [Chthoniobacteraceae bacterium]|jgi:hypothetical protein